jgi:hypothetical protein
MDPKPLPYLGRLQKAQRLVKSAMYRSDPKLAVRELCEAVAELTTALIEREGGTEVVAGNASPGQTPPG